MNTNRQLLKETTIELEVDGSGKTIKDATADIFKKIHKQIYQELSVPIIQMETHEVYFDEISTEQNKRSVLGKESESTLVKARVYLRVKYLDIKEEVL